jgi:DNA helicase HerA-like ATPase
VKTAAETFVPNPPLDVAAAIGQLGVGEALCSMLSDPAGGGRGIPAPVERTLVAPPRCRMGAITDAERAQVRAGSPVGAKYDNAVDRDSAAEMLARKASAAGVRNDAPPASGDALPGRAGNTRDDDRGAGADAGSGSGGFGQAIKDALFGTRRRQGMVETMAKQAARTVGSQVGRQILRGVLGGMLGGRR